jgi:hypothetical protein
LRLHIYSFRKISGGSWFNYCRPCRWGGHSRCISLVINQNLAVIDYFCNI